MTIITWILFIVGVIATLSVGALFNSTRGGYERWILSLSILATSVAFITFFVGGRLAHLF